MATTNDPNETRAADEFLLYVPAGDHPLTAEHLAHTAIASFSRALTELTEVLDVHADMAPASALWVIDLANGVADLLFAWLKQSHQP
ncbi:hypothetical protein [Nocardia cyriacigeorgica]|uniref:hypothetical protein n=1 Tax=Nocardia cyriacigeorgica TaxID=135487 RepID=UPI002456CAB7|nr:hypothetical protein [Nocardia cyriacigeorgica]